MYICSQTCSETPSPDNLFIEYLCVNKLKFNRAQLIYSRVSVHIAESQQDILVWRDKNVADRRTDARTPCEYSANSELC
jgi:hypothetical protein